MTMKYVVVCLLSLIVVLGVMPAHAADSNELFGTPVVLDSGLMMLDGRQVSLWGIETLAEDQKCWQADRAWDCGEQATIVLKHFIEGQLVKCQTKDVLGDGGIGAQCFRIRGDKTNDIARYMIMQGWAMDDEETSGGLYEQDEDVARQQRRGIWTSRFQTAEDWRDGIQEFVEYDMIPEAELAPKIVNQTIINNNTTNIFPLKPRQNDIYNPPSPLGPHNTNRDSRVAPVSSPVTAGSSAITEPVISKPMIKSKELKFTPPRSAPDENMRSTPIPSEPVQEVDPDLNDNNLFLKK